MDRRYGMQIYWTMHQTNAFTFIYKHNLSSVWWETCLNWNSITAPWICPTTLSASRPNAGKQIEPASGFKIVGNWTVVNTNSPTESDRIKIWGIYTSDKVGWNVRWAPFQGGSSYQISPGSSFWKRKTVCELYRGFAGYEWNPEIL